MKLSKQLGIAIVGMATLLTWSGCSEQNKPYSTTAGGSANTNTPAVTADTTSPGVTPNAPPASVSANTNALDETAKAIVPALTETSALSAATNVIDTSGAVVRAPGQATADLEPTQGNTVRGTISFTATNEGVRVVADLTGLTEGDHGIHIHDKGDCSAPDAKSAGDHFNPTGMPHGGPDAQKHHAGDLGNITGDSSGKGHLDRVFNFLSLSGTNSIVGHSVIVHAGKDDLTSQPAGNAGNRVACGVIRGS